MPGIRRLRAACAILVFAFSSSARSDDGIFDAAGVELLSWVQLAEFAYAPAAGNDVGGYVSPAGREFVIMGLNNQTAFVDITEPRAPEIIYEHTHCSEIWSDMDTDGTYAFVVTDGCGSGIQIFDLSNIDAGEVTFLRAYDGLGQIRQAHNIAANDGFAYLVGGPGAAGGIVSVDVRNPAKPQMADTWSQRPLHDVHVITYTEGPYAGREIAFCAAQGAGVAIVDVTDKSAFATLAVDVTYPGIAYCHQAWTSEDRRYLFSNDELDESGPLSMTRTFVFDIEDLTDPQYLGYFTNGLPATDHNLMVQGDYVFEANYRSGLRVYDISRVDEGVDQIVEIGFFDTFPGSDASGFQGAWGVFAGFPSGTVVVSDRDRGLFVLDPFVTRLRPFADATSAPLDVEDASWGVAWVDADGDEDLDLYVSNSDAPNQLLLNDGAGSFSDATTPILEGPADTGGAVWGDIDGDGDLDLYIIVSDEPNQMLRNDGVGDELRGGAPLFVDVTTPELADNGRGRGAACADFDLDGDLDLYLANHGAPDPLYRNDGGVLVDVAADVGLGQLGSSLGVSWSDYDADGDPDIAVAAVGSNRLLRNDGGVFTDVSVPGDVWRGRSASVAWGDADGDGDPDLYVANMTGVDGLFRNDGADTFVDVAAELGLDTEGESMSATWGDYDHDRRLDLFVADRGRGVRLYRNREDGFFDITGANFLDSGAVFGLALGDHDRDGDLDLYATNSEGGNHLYENRAAGELKWLEIALESTLSVTFGVGARIEVTTSGVTQVREVRAGTGFQSQEGAVACFGLGTSTIAESIRVHWPAGGVSLLTDVATNARVVISEDPSTPIGDDDPGTDHQPDVVVVTPRLHAASPNPFNPRTRIAFDLVVPSATALAVYDLGGRELRTLVREGRVLPAGRHVVVWDGRDAEGRAVGSGVYFYRLRTAGYESTRPVTLLR